MRIIFALSTLLPFLATEAFAQNKLPVYNDGIYASYEDFIKNTPTITFSNYDIEWDESKFFNQLKIKEIEKRNAPKKERKVDGRTFWGICVGGVPYIQYGFGNAARIHFGNQAGSKNGKANFTRIRIIGNICHFNVEDFVSSENRLTQAITNQVGSDGQLVREQKIMKTSTGQVADFNQHTMMAFIKDDSNLYRHFLKSDSREAKIFLYLQKYNERNPLMVAR